MKEKDFVVSLSIFFFRIASIVSTFVYVAIPTRSRVYSHIADNRQGG